MSVNRQGVEVSRTDASVGVPRVNNEEVDYEYASLLKQVQECLSRKEAIRLIHKYTELMQKKPNG